MLMHSPENSSGILFIMERPLSPTVATPHKSRRWLSRRGVLSYTIGALISYSMSSSGYNLIEAHHNTLISSISKMQGQPESFAPIENYFRIHFSRIKMPAASLDNRELQLAFNAATKIAGLAYYYSRNLYPDYLDDVHNRYNELRSRNILSAQHCTDMAAVLIQSRRFDELDRLATTCPLPDDVPVPIIHVEEGFDPENPAIILLRDDSDEYIARNVDLNSPVQIIVVGSCHFARDAAKMISMEPGVREAFLKANTIWLDNHQRALDPTFSREWITDVPLFPISAPYADTAWKNISFTDSPGFYFLIEGEVVTHVLGWDNTIPSAIYDALQLVGLMR